MQRFVFYFAYPFLWLIAHLPDRLLYGLSDGICFLIYRLIGYRKKVVRRNLCLAFPDKPLAEIKQIETAFYHHFCDIFLEMIRTMGLSQAQMQQRMTYTNKELIEDFYHKGQSVIIMCGHYNSYEWLLSLAAQISHTSYALYTPITNRYFDRFVRRLREKFHSYLISRYKAIEEIRRLQHEGVRCAYGLASDQSPSPNKAYWRSFMGIEVPVFTGAERIAKQFNIPVVFCDIQKKRRGYYEATFTLITDAPATTVAHEITDTFTQLLEAQIRRAPQYYLWTHNRFKHAKEIVSSQHL